MSMAMPREDNSLERTRQNDVIAESLSRADMASRRDVSTVLSCFGLLMVGVWIRMASTYED